MFENTELHAHDLYRFYINENKLEAQLFLC